jgi:hypothetical protein
MDFCDDKFVGFQETTGGFQARDPGLNGRYFNGGITFPVERVPFNGRNSRARRLPAAAADRGSIGTYTISSQACNTQCRH